MLFRSKLLLAKSQDVLNRLALMIVEAQIQAASGKQDEALRNLSIATRDAARSGFVPELFEARLAHAEILLASGKIAGARTELAVLRKNAADRGFGLIAQKATALTSKGRPPAR